MLLRKIKIKLPITAEKNQQLQKVSKLFGLKVTARKLKKIKISNFRHFKA